MSSNKEEIKNPIVEVKEAIETPSAFENFIEDPLSNAETVYSKYKKLINVVGTSVVVVLAAFVGWKYYIGSQESDAKTQMFQAVYYFEADSLTKALNGDGNYPGLVEIADDYGMTPSGNLAKFYVGVAFMKQGKFEEAIGYLKSFGSSDLLVQARAYSLIGDAYMELNQFEDAVSYYGKAVGYKPNKEFTPIYMLKKGLAQEKSGDLEGALETYNSLLEKYPNSVAATDAKRNQGVVESLLNK